MAPRIPVFDFGRVLVEWDPGALYRRLIPEPERRAWFFAHVCTPDWHGALPELIAERSAAFPDWAEEIAAWWQRWDEMIPRALPGTVALHRHFRDQGRPLYAITNFPADALARTEARFPFLAQFDGRAVSGRLGLVKPAREIYEWLLDSHGLDPAELVFIDDKPANVETARALGMTGIVFAGAGALADRLAALGLIEPAIAAEIRRAEAAAPPPLAARPPAAQAEAGGF